MYVFVCVCVYVFVCVCMCLCVVIVCTHRQVAGEDSCEPFNGVKGWQEVVAAEVGSDTRTVFCDILIECLQYVWQCWLLTHVQASQVVLREEATHEPKPTLFTRLFAHQYGKQGYEMLPCPVVQHTQEGSYTDLLHQRLCQEVHALRVPHFWIQYRHAVQNTVECLGQVAILGWK